MSEDRILIRATNWLGDAVMSLLAIRAVRSRFPQAEMHILARPAVAGLFDREGCASQVIGLTLARGLRGLPGLPEWRARLRRERYTCAIILPNSFDSALLPFLARIPRRIGYARDGRRLLLTDPIAPPAPGQIPAHERFYYLELLRRAGLLDSLPPEEPLTLACAPEARQAGLQRFEEVGFRGPVAGLSPGAANSRAKQWPPEKFIDAACQIAATLGCSIAVFGTDSERLLCEEVARAIRDRGWQARNLAGSTTLASFIDLAAACQLFLTNDSGAMHVASALGVPTVAVFGPTNEFTTGPLGPRTSIVREPVPCMRCMYRDCPIDHRCMNLVSPEQVAAAALDLLK